MLLQGCFLCGSNQNLKQCSIVDPALGARPEGTSDKFFMFGTFQINLDSERNYITLCDSHSPGFLQHTLILLPPIQNLIHLIEIEREDFAARLAQLLVLHTSPSPRTPFIDQLRGERCDCEGVSPPGGGSKPGKYVNHFQYHNLSLTPTLLGDAMEVLDPDFSYSSSTKFTFRYHPDIVHNPDKPGAWPVPAPVGQCLEGRSSDDGFSTLLYDMAPVFPTTPDSSRVTDVIEPLCLIAHAMQGLLLHEPHLSPLQKECLEGILLLRKLYGRVLTAEECPFPFYPTLMHRPLSREQPVDAIESEPKRPRVFDEQLSARSNRQTIPAPSPAARPQMAQPQPSPFRSPSRPYPHQAPPDGSSLRTPTSSRQWPGRMNNDVPLARLDVMQEQIRQLEKTLAGMMARSLPSSNPASRAAPTSNDHLPRTSMSNNPPLPRPPKYNVPSSTGPSTFDPHTQSSNSQPVPGANHPLNVVPNAVSSGSDSIRQRSKHIAPNNSIPTPTAQSNTQLPHQEQVAPINSIETFDAQLTLHESPEKEATLRRSTSVSSNSGDARTNTTSLSSSSPEEESSSYVSSSAPSTFSSNLSPPTAALLKTRMAKSGKRPQMSPNQDAGLRSNHPINVLDFSNLDREGIERFAKRGWRHKHERSPNIRKPNTNN